MKKPVFILTLIAVLGTLGWVGLQWLENLKGKQIFIQKVTTLINGHTPFQVTTLDLDWSWGRFKTGDVHGIRIDAVERHSHTRFKARMDIETSLSLAQFLKPGAAFENIDIKGTIRDLNITEGAVAAAKLTSIDLRGELLWQTRGESNQGHLRLQIDPLEIPLDKLYRLELPASHLDLAWEDHQIRADLKWKTWLFTRQDRAKEDESLSIAQPILHLRAQRPDTHSFYPLVSADGTFKLGRIEALRDSDFFVLPPGFLDSTFGLAWDARENIGYQLHVPHLGITARLIPHPTRGYGYDFRFETASLRKILEPFRHLAPLAFVDEWTWIKDPLSFRSAGEMSGLGSGFTRQKSHFKLGPLTVFQKNKALSAQDLTVEIDSESIQDPRGTLHLKAPKLFFKRLPLAISSLDIGFSFDSQTHEIAFSAPKKGLIKVGSSPITLEGIQGALDQSGPHIQLSAHSPASPLADFQKGLCLGGLKTLPGQYRVNFELLEFGPDEIQVEGEFAVDLFSGIAKIDGLSIYHYRDESPELQFDLEWERLQLKDLADYTGLGTMDGTVKGYFKNAVFRGGFGTHYDFRFEVMPYSHKHVVFSPEAMKNVVQIFAGESYAQMPGYAQWFAFGWPATLFGGFDVDYAGIEAHSNEGYIQVKTLRDDEHFLLKGPRMKIPLHSSKYPPVVEATAMGGFVRFLAHHFESLVDKKKREAADAAPRSSFLIENEDQKPVDTTSDACFDPL